MKKLTKKQEKMLVEIRDEWLKIGLSTEPANRELAQKAACLAYKNAGLPEPKIFIWLRSPLEGAIGAQFLASLKKLKNNHKITDQVRDQALAQVGAQVGDQVWNQVRGQVGEQVRDQVWNQVRGQVGEQVWEQVKDQIKDQAWRQISNACYGNQDAGWLSFYYAFNVFGVKSTERLRGLFELAKNCGWFWPFEGIVVFTDRPAIIKRDSQNRLHCEDGPSLVYRDGFSVCAWHGLRIKDQRILCSPETITVEQIKAEENAEIRRVMIEKFGRQKYINECGAKIKSVDQRGTLYVDRGFAFVRVLNSTPEPDGSVKEYFLPVPPTIKTPTEGIAWTFEVTEHEYNPLVET